MPNMNDNDLDLTVNDSEIPGAVIVAATGEIDSSNCLALQDLLTSLAGKATKDVQVDLAGVSFIDSSGLRALIVGQRTITESGGALRVSAASDSVRRLFEITGLVERLSLGD
jgi:anti-sigma B factor antagonist